MRKFALVLVVFGSFALAGCSNFDLFKSNETADPGCSAAAACSAAATCNADKAASCPIAAAAAKKACGDDCTKPCCADK